MRREKGFTLIEMVMVILLLGILAAIAIPNFIDFRKDAKDGATQGALGAYRSALSISVAAVQLKEDPTANTPKYPTYTEVAGNAFNASHPVLTGTAILEAGVFPVKNPWTQSSAPAADFSAILDCDGQAKGSLLAAPLDDRGWCYNQTTGQIWANSDKNGGPVTENGF